MNPKNMPETKNAERVEQTHRLFAGKFRDLSEAISAAGLPALFQEPCAEHWENEGEFDPDSLIIERDALEDGGELRVSFRHDVWWILNHPIWTETAGTVCCAEQRIEFTLQFDDDRTVVSTMYVAILREFTTKSVTVQGKHVYVCTAKYDVRRWVYEESP